MIIRRLTVQTRTGSTNPGNAGTSNDSIKNNPYYVGSVSTSSTYFVNTADVRAWSPSVTTSILACSAATTKISPEHLALFTERRLCEDRKGWVEHLYPVNLFKSTARIIIVQASQIVSFYLTDQLKTDTERDAKVEQGKMTRQQADKESDEWAEREWRMRMEQLPNKICISLMKYHAITVVMRIYEYVASKRFSEVTLDKLTLDVSACARRITKDTKNRTEIFQSMFTTCWNANIVSYLADCNVHQIILLHGYYLYVQHQRKSVREKRNDSKNNTAEALESGSFILSFFKKSTMILINRGIGLTFASLGGAVGTLVRPGLGTSVGINLGDLLGLNLASGLLSDAPAL